MNLKDITFVVPTSVLVTHPDTSIIDQVVSSIRNYFPDNEIILQVDGLREEQAHRKEQYDEYKNRILWKCLHEYRNVLPIIFEEYSHQSNMMHKTIDLIRTPLMFYIEGDISLKENIDVDWEEVVSMLSSKKAYTVRFYTYNNVIEPVHMDLMLEQEGNFIKTFQWSQQPHVSHVSYYKNMVLPNTTPKLFIEDKFYSKVFSDCHETPRRWKKHRLWLYNPPGQDIRIVDNLDGRKNLRKFTDDDIAWGLTEA
jgi:hypothetical protein